MYYTFHCSSMFSGNYRIISEGKNQSEAFGKLNNREKITLDLVCVSVSTTRRDAEIVAPRIQ